MRFLFILLCLISASAGAQTIYEIQGQVDVTPYADQEVTTSGIVTAVDGSGYYIQDGQGMWNGIYVYDQNNAPELGDEVEVTATAVEFYDFTELTTITAFTVLSSGNNLPGAEILNTGDVADEGWEGVLLQISAAECTNADLGFGEFELNDGSGSCRVDDLFYLFTASEGVQYGVTGPCYYSFGDYKIVPRGQEDVIIAEPLYFTINPEEFNMTTSSLEINWNTNEASNSIVQYGLTDTYEIGTIADETAVTEHSVIIDGLEEATSYYVRVFSENGEDSTPLFDRVVSTTSSIGGEITVWFNHSVDTSVSTGMEALSTDNITDSIVNYINSSEYTLDIAIYDMLDINPLIITAINGAFANGVQVRFISDLEAENLALGNLNDDIPVLTGNNDGIMHDKFLIVDAEYAVNAKLMTGSMNWTGANLGWDFNNIIIIEDQALARTYTREFNEMWGSEELEPDVNAALFGQNKTDNTAHKFIIGGIEIESYFSPSDGTTAQIRERIDATEDRIALGMMVFTENSLGNAMIQAHAAGVDVDGIIDYVEFNGSEFMPLLDAGVNVIDYQNEDGSQWPDGPVFHHKYCLIDFEETSSTPVLITGSHNWTASAESINDENTLIIYDHSLANQFYQEWTERWDELTTSIEENTAGIAFKAYPNPTNGIINIKSTSQGQLMVFDAQSRLIVVENINFLRSIDLSRFGAGHYTLRFETEAGTTEKQIILQ
ncbi:MAG: phospholipase D-like domain-containing protein [Flavobacteriales bacterium]|nr:phospholipase D-like domain-containing protein [Flavobacteriales bacterium]